MIKLLNIKFPGLQIHFKDGDLIGGTEEVYVYIFEFLKGKLPKIQFTFSNSFLSYVGLNDMSSMEYVYFLDDNVGYFDKQFYHKSVHDMLAINSLEGFEDVEEDKFVMANNIIHHFLVG